LQQHFFFFLWFLVFIKTDVSEKYINTKIKMATGALPTILPLFLILRRLKKGILSKLKQSMTLKGACQKSPLQETK